MKCKHCKHYRQNKILLKSGSCKLKNTQSYTDFRKGNAKACKYFEPQESEVKE